MVIFTSKVEQKMSLKEAFGWSEDRVSVLKHLWGEGLSATKIANRIGGVSRNAVIGKVHRLGLPSRIGRQRATRKLLAFRPTRSKPQGINFRAKKPPTQREVVRLVMAVEMAAPEMLKLDLLDLRADSCRFPCGDPKNHDFGFCGRRKEDGISYCGFHARVVFQPVVGRMR
jgi:GcrA cell cycle regulator